MTRWTAPTLDRTRPIVDDRGRFVGGKLIVARSRAVLIPVLVAVLGSGLAAAPARAASPSTLYVDVDPQAGVYGPITLDLASDWHTISRSSSTVVDGQAVLNGGSPVGFSVGDDHWTVTFRDLSGTPTAGTYDVPVPVNGVCGDICAEIRAMSDHGFCDGAGTFTIHAISFDVAGDLKSVDADFRLACLSDWMSGSIRFHSASDTIALDQDVDRMFFDPTTAGDTTEAQTVTITNFGDVATDLGSAALSGDAAADYEITADDCSGSHLTVGATCSVSVRFAPVGTAIRIAQLDIPDGTSRGSRQVRLVGSAFHASSASLTPSSPTYGPGHATFTYVVSPADAGSPALFIDDIQAFGPSDAVTDGGATRTWVYDVVVGPGHHAATTRFDPNGWYLPTTVPPVEFDVGVATSLTLTTATDDLVAAGESADIVATLDAGGPIAGGTIRIRDGNTILAQAPAAGSTTSVEATIPTIDANRTLNADYVPESNDVEASSAQYELVVVDGPRPETLWDTSTLYTSSTQVWLDGYSSPDPGVSFECRVDTSNWFDCPVPMAAQSFFGDHVLAIRAIRPDGLADRTPATRPWVIETTPPTVTAPSSQPLAAALVSGAEPVRVTWQGTDGRSGVDGYEAAQSTDNASYLSIASDLGAAALVRNLATGHSYRFRVRAIDRAGNVGAWAYGSTFHLTAVSQSNSAVRYAGSWSTSTNPIWWGGTARSSSSKGATASYTFTGRSIAWVGLRAATRGKAAIYVNGVYKATVDLYSVTTKKQTIVWASSWSTSAKRTITIKVLGTAGRPRVDVDGFIVGS
jgi:hypothetical protein